MKPMLLAARILLPAAVAPLAAMSQCASSGAAPVVQPQGGGHFGEASRSETPSAALSLNTSADGSLSFAGGGISINAFFPGWATARIEADAVAAEDDAAHILGPAAGRPFAIVRPGDGSTAFRGRAVWKERGDGTVAGDIRVEALAPVTMQCLALAVESPAEPPSGLGSFTAQEISVPLNGGRSLRLSFSTPQGCFAQDSRPWGGGWTTRFGDLRRTRGFAPGEVAEWHVVISAPSGAPVALSEGTPITIAEGDHWLPFVYHKDIVAGSALDFSGLGFQDAPAGKHGWLKSVGGHFEFEGLPGVEQRFYGANLCFTANYPGHDLADRLVERFVRCGYNAVRIHHHDEAWAAAYAARSAGGAGFVPGCSGGGAPGGSGGGAPRPFADDIDRLDYLLAKCYERGLYVTTDLYVSRAVPWRGIGVDRDGNVPVNLYKTLVGIDDGAFADWCRWAEAFLCHVNPYTGRAAKDEPGMPLISLVNEGALRMGYADKAGAPRVREAWREFCASRGVVRGDEPPSGNGAPGFGAFEEWLNRRVFERCSAHVRALGCRALLTNDNNGGRHGEGEGCTPLYDYVDSHFYVDHPQFLAGGWTVPSRCVNLNPVRGGGPAIFGRGWAKGASKPYVISEWNFCGPGRYRGVGGILTGALAAEQEWDGLWRFAYSHSNGNLVDGKGNMGYFDCATDPLVAASDRASVCLFLRSDAPCGALRLDKARGAMSLVTPRLCGGFAESGRIEAGALSFAIIPSKSSTNPSSSAPATLWVSSLDGSPVSSSSRLLLVHLTDVQGNWVRYADETRQVLLKWGVGHLVEAGEAEVELWLDGSAPPSVWSLDTAGNRLGEVPVSWEHGTLRFRVSTRGEDGKGRIYYEIVR